MKTREIAERKYSSGKVRTILVLGILIAANACNGGRDGNESPATPSATTAEATTTTRVGEKAAKLIFNDLLDEREEGQKDKASQVIMVYPGTGTSAQDRTANGTFYEGNKVDILCKQTGRMVSSHPELGEDKRESDVWYLIGGTPGEVQFATAVYADVTPPGAVIRAC